MSKGTIYFVRNGRIVEPGVPSIHDPEYQLILKDKRALCKEYGIQVSDVDDDSSLFYDMIMAMKSLLHDTESDDSLECVSKLLDEIETVCLGCYSNYGAQLILKENFLKTINDIKETVRLGCYSNYGAQFILTEKFLNTINSVKLIITKQI